MPPRKPDRPLAGSASAQSRAAQTQTRTPEEAERWQRAGRLVRDGRRAEAEELLESLMQEEELDRAAPERALMQIPPYSERTWHQ